MGAVNAKYLVVIAKYLIALIAGVIFGISFPTLLPDWMLAATPIAVIIVTEIIGQWGFGRSHWREYRIPAYIIYSGVVVSALLGILLGNGMVGRLLVWIGTSIS